MKRRILSLSTVLALLLGLSSVVCGQVWEEWVARYVSPGFDDDSGNYLALDLEGNVYVTGCTSVNPSWDYLTIKYSSSGLQEWAVIYDSPWHGNDFAQDIAVSSQGNAYVTGWSEDSLYNTTAITIKYNSDGEELWVVSEPNAVARRGLVIDSNENVYLTIACFNDWSRTTIKYDSSGAEQWRAVHTLSGYPLYDYYNVALDNLGNVYVAGEFGFPSVGITIKYNSYGEELWAAEYVCPGYPEIIINSIGVDPMGNVYVSGYRFLNLPMTDFLLIKYDSTGSEQWVQFYDGPDHDHDAALALAVDNEGNAYLAGDSKIGGIVNWLVLK